MKARLLIGVVLCLVGLVWVGQGIGLIGGSFMTGDGVWAVIGVICIAFGAALMRPQRR